MAGDGGSNSGLNLDMLRGFTLSMLIIKGILGVSLIVCAILGNIHMKDQQTFGPPYYIGAFVVGFFITLAAVFVAWMFWLSSNVDPELESSKKRLGRALMAYIVCTSLALFGCLVGFFFVAWGLKGCEDPSDSSNSCNYTDYIPTNKRLATAIFVFLVLTVIICTVAVFFMCCSQATSSVRLKTRLRRPPPDRRGLVVIDPRTRRVFLQPRATTTSLGVDGVAPCDEQVRNLEEENRLLREQLELRQQLGEEQPRPQHQGAMYDPDPRPQHQGAMYDPEAPPPSYNDVIEPHSKRDPRYEKVPYTDNVAEPSAPPMW